MVTVSISETYDLHTEVDKMTLIGIHTPTKELIQKTYPGLAMNCKYFRVKSVDVALSTAQTLPLGVDQIGLDEGQIHPQDMMNPILYKAVSNDSWSTLEARLHGLNVQVVSGTSALQPPLKGDMAFAEDDGVTGLADEHGVYYSLLSNRDGFKIAHPQQGLSMKGLVPLVFEKFWTHGENFQSKQSGTAVDFAPAIVEGNDGNLGVGYSYAYAMRGRPHPMPKINTTYLTSIGGSGTGERANGMGTGTPTNLQTEMPDIPPVMLAAIVLPPVSATTGILYYRMVTRAWIEFTDVRPIQEVTSFAQMSSVYASLVYHTDYNEQSKNMDQTTDMVDIKNGTIEKIMEGR